MKPAYNGSTGSSPESRHRVHQRFQEPVHSCGLRYPQHITHKQGLQQPRRLADPHLPPRGPGRAETSSRESHRSPPPNCAWSRRPRGDAQTAILRSLGVACVAHRGRAPMLRWTGVDTGPLAITVTHSAHPCLSAQEWFRVFGGSSSGNPHRHRGSGTVDRVGRVRLAGASGHGGSGCGRFPPSFA